MRRKGTSRFYENAEADWGPKQGKSKLVQQPNKEFRILGCQTLCKIALPGSFEPTALRIARINEQLAELQELHRHGLDFFFIRSSFTPAGAHGEYHTPAGQPAGQLMCGIACEA